MNKHNVKIIFVISIIIYISYYLSAFLTNWFGYFFESITKGQDFFQIPNAAFAFLHGGDLFGNLQSGINAYTTCCGVNNNVYHPLLTLILGIPLQLVPPWTAFYFWVGIHFIIQIILGVFLWKKFPTHKYLYLALSLLFFNSYQYYEIQHAQYHFLLNFFTILFLYETCLKNDTKKAGLFLFLSLLIKPIGFLWILPLLIAKRFKTVCIGLGLFIIVSIPFYFFPFSMYYFENLQRNLQSVNAAYNLTSIIHLFPVSIEIFKPISYLCMIGLLLFQIIKKPPLFTTIFLWIAFQLLFYPLVFHYHYSILGGLFSLGILLNVFSVKKVDLIPIILLTIPTPIIYLRAFGAPSHLTIPQYSFIALWSVFLLIIVCLRLMKVTFQKDSV